MQRNHTVCAAAASILALSAMLCSPAAADMSQTYDFWIFNLPAGQTLSPGLHYTVDVSDSDVDDGQVRFRISNISTGGASSIAGIYFDDGALLQIASVQNSTGVLFVEDSIDNPGQPRELPGANLLTPHFETSFNPTDYTGKKNAFYAMADSDPPVYWNGVGNSEHVDIIYNLTPGQSVADVIAAMTLGAMATTEIPGMLRVGIHIQNATTDGESVSAVSVPAPAAVVLGLIGLGALGVWKRRYC